MMATETATARLDVTLVQRGLARSRTHAARLVADGCVTVAGRAASKPALPVSADAEITVDTAEDWASRGAHKLLGALDHFGISVEGTTALDAGASTGGFTDVLLRRGATRVVAVDVGRGQLAAQLAADPRVHVHDSVNLHHVTDQQRAAITADLADRADIVVADLSFISLTLVLPILTELAAPHADLLPMIKPQFEVGKGNLGSGGVVRDPQRRAEAIATVIDAAAGLGWGVAGIVASPLPGPAGNVEYFAHLRTDAAAADPDRLIRRAIQDGPA